MATAYPGALDTTGSQLRTDIASTDDLDASGKQHDVMHVNVHGATVALETKLGLTDSNAVNKAILVGSAASTTSWTTSPTIGGTVTLDGSGGGLKMDGLDSADANTLDDYEEGTFTVAFTAGSGSITADTSYNTCSYVKIGKVVHIQGQIGVSSVSTPSGALNMTGLPFASANGLAQSADWVANLGTIIDLASDPSGGGSVYGRITNNSSSINWRAQAGTSAGDSTIADLIDAGTWFWVGGTYTANI